MSVFSRVSSPKIRRSAFNLSYDKKFNCDMGQLIPVMADEVVPGDVFNIGNEVVIRFQPLVAPVLHEINVYIHYFFVPYRILWHDSDDVNWENFITGGEDGTDASTLPRWNPTNNGKYSLWDYLGFPIGVKPNGALPLSFPKRAYNMIWNEYYRDENLQDPVNIDQENILNRCWEKDYFSSALPWQQRGIAPALPISGTTSAVFSNDLRTNVDSNWTMGVNGLYAEPVDNYTRFKTKVDVKGDTTHSHLIPASQLNNNTVDLSNATTFDVSDLRLAFQIQKWLERNARGGARYTEFLRAHFGVAPRDERLQRPEYLGGTKSPILVSEVLQTSSTDTTSPQGNLAGHGISVAGNHVCRYHAKEFGVIIGLMSIMPRTAYMQGINRQWLRRTRYDFYSPEFAHLSEQGIERAEIYADDNETDNQTLFGYQGRYNEMRKKQSMVCADMRDTFDFWHLARKFSTPPMLNSSFVSCVPRKDIFAVQNEPGIIVNMSNDIIALRPMPINPDPGLIDHA
jgi:hypothetical protein